MTGYLDQRDDNWLGHRTHEALHPLTDKIWHNFKEFAGNWELWTQFELAYSLSKSTKASHDAALIANLYDTVSTSFAREEKYDERGRYGNNQIADFSIRASRDELNELHFIELKCRSSKEDIATFVRRVAGDIDKVQRMKFDGLHVDMSKLSLWVMAISVTNFHSADLDQKMLAAAELMGIQWQVLELSQDNLALVRADETELLGPDAEANPPSGATYLGSIKIWTWTKDVRGQHIKSVFTYSEQLLMSRLQSSAGWPPHEEQDRAFYWPEPPS